jgi:hypothetical protein
MPGELYDELLADHSGRSQHSHVNGAVHAAASCAASLPKKNPPIGDAEGGFLGSY